MGSIRGLSNSFRGLWSMDPSHGTLGVFYVLRRFILFG